MPQDERFTGGQVASHGLGPLLGGGPRLPAPLQREGGESPILTASVTAIENVMRELDEDCGCGKKKRKLA